MTALIIPGTDGTGGQASNTGDRALLGMLAVFAASLFLIPDRYTVPLVAGLGLRPQQMVVVAMSIGVMVGFRRGRRLDVGRPALVAGLLAVVGVASLVVNVAEVQPAAYLGAVRLIVTLTLLALLAVVVAAVASTPRRRRYLLGFIVTFVAVAAIFAIHESATQKPFRLNPTPPGLVEQQDATTPPGETPTTIIRNGVARPAGLAANPLELSAVMALAAPFAVYLALSTRHWQARLWFLSCSLLIGLGLVLSLSRTGVLSAAVMLVVALVANLRRPRIVLLGLLAVAVLGFSVARLVPNSVESLTKQIGKDGTDDPSLATRLQDYDELDRLLGPHPWLGGGPNSITTYVSRDGTGMILDNQYLLAIAETGIVGLTVMVGLVVSTATAAIRRCRDNAGERGLFVAVLCATAAFALMAGTFDVLRFNQASSMFMVVVGLAASGGAAANGRFDEPGTSAA